MTNGVEYWSALFGMLLGFTACFGIFTIASGHFTLRFNISGFFVRVFTFRFFASAQHCMDTGAQEAPNQANDRLSAFGILRKTTITKAHVQAILHAY